MNKDLCRFQKDSLTLYFMYCCEPISSLNSPNLNDQEPKRNYKVIFHNAIKATIHYYISFLLQLKPLTLHLILKPKPSPIFYCSPKILEFHRLTKFQHRTFPTEVRTGLNKFNHKIHSSSLIFFFF